VVGARVEASLHELGQSVEDYFWVPGTVDNITGTVQKILLKIDQWQQDDVEQVMLFHHARQQRGNYPPQARQLLPVDLSSFNHKQKKPWPSRSVPQFSLPAEKLLSSLIRQQLFIKLFNACAESLAGEHASRLMSMQVAEKNIQERLESLTASHTVSNARGKLLRSYLMWFLDLRLCRMRGNRKYSLINNPQLSNFRRDPFLNWRNKMITRKRTNKPEVFIYE
jgi:alternate F1F0 ATPase F1 subunit gamma